MLLAELPTTPLDVKEIAREAARNPHDFRYNLILFTCLAGLAALIFLVVWLLKRRRHEFRRSAWSDSEHREKFSGSPKLSTGRERRRRRRREHRPRNPTLDQTGGLPPKREESGS